MPSGKKKVKQPKVGKLESKKIAQEAKKIAKSADAPRKGKKRAPVPGMSMSAGGLLALQANHQALLESEQKYKELVNSLPQVVFETDKKGNLTFVNRSALERYGYSKKDFDKGLSVVDLIAPEDRDRVREDIKRRLRGEELASEEYTALRKDGSIFPVVAHSRPIVRENKVVGLRGIVVDITERKLAQGKLAEANRLLETLLDHTHMMVAYLDPEFNFVKVNRAYAEADGRAPSFFPGKNHFSLYPNAENEGIFRRVVETGEPYFASAKPFEYAEHPERGVSYWDWSLIPIRDSAGAVTGLVLTLVNVTERKQAEQALSQSEERLRRFMESATDSFTLWDKDLNVVETNEAGLKTYAAGTKKADVIGKNMLELVPGLIESGRYDQYVKVIQTGKPFHADDVVVDPRFGRRRVAVRAFKVGDGLGMVVTDITERRRTEEALTAEKEFTETALNAQTDTFFVFEPSTGRAVRWNKAFNEVSGYSDEEIRSMKAPASYYNQEDLKKAAVASRKILNEGIATVELSLITKDGRSIPTEYTGAAIRDDEGNPHYIIAVGRDVTERKRVEETIRQQNEFLNNVIESLTHPFYVIDVNDYTIKAANSAAGLDGLSATPTCYALTHRRRKPCEGSEHSCPLKEVKETKKPVVAEHMHYDKEGRARNVEVYAYPISDSEKNVVQMIEYCLDVTERKRAEEALRESEEKFRSLAEQSPNMIFINQKGRVKYANERCYEIMGYQKGEFHSPDFNFLDLVAPEYRGLVQKNLSRHVAGEEFVPYEYALITKEGKRIEAIVNSKLIRYGGELAILGVITDITQLKRAQAEIEELNRRLRLRAEELAAANRELEAFSYSVSHDLRAPLRALEGFSRALAEDYSDSLDEEGKDYLGRIRAASQHMKQLIDGLLNLSLTVRVQMRREKTDLSELARAIAAELQKTQPERQVQFVIQEGLLAHGDPQLLRDMLENLLGNAWKFTEKHSHAKIEFGVTKEERQNVYFVRDDGAGFDKTHAEKLFVPFQRLHSTAEFSGNGIGLAVVSRIITRHGGRIWAESEVEKGATFYFTL